MIVDLLVPKFYRKISNSFSITPNFQLLHYYCLFFVYKYNTFILFWKFNNTFIKSAFREQSVYHTITAEFGNCSAFFHESRIYLYINRSVVKFALSGKYRFTLIINCNDINFCTAVPIRADFWNMKIKESYANVQ